jgi:hypothetical protein
VIERLELLAEVLLKRRAVADVGAVFILQVAKFREKFFFHLAFERARCDHRFQSLHDVCCAQLNDSCAAPERFVAGCH